MFHVYKKAKLTLVLVLFIVTNTFGQSTSLTDKNEIRSLPNEVISEIFNIDLNNGGGKEIERFFSSEEKIKLTKRQLDLNNDNHKDYIIENLSPGYIGSGGWSTYIFFYKAGNYELIQEFFGGEVKVLETSTNNIKDLSFEHKKYLDEGAFENVTDHLKWNGQKYKKEENFVSNRTISQPINEELKVELQNKAENFFNAYQNYNGKKVLDLVSKNSIDKHYEYRDYVLYATYEELTEMDMFDIIMTLSFRALFSKNEIIDVGKKEFFLLQYDKERRIGEVGRPSNIIKYENYKRTNSNSISIDAKDLASGESSPIFFVKKDGKWKVDLTKDYEFRREYYHKQLPNGIDKKELIRTVVNQLESTNEKLLEPLINQ